MTLPSYSPWWTKSLVFEENPVIRVLAPINSKQIEPMIPSRTASSSKKGDKATLGQASHGSRQRLGQETMVHRTQLVLAPSVSQTQMPGGEVPFHT